MTVKLTRSKQKLAKGEHRLEKIKLIEKRFAKTSESYSAREPAAIAARTRQRKGFEPVAAASGMQSKDGEDTLKGLPTWLGDLWGLASPQPPAALSRQSSMSRTSSKPTLPVFFDRDGRVGPTKLWLKETHAVAGLTLDKDAKEKQKQEAELARAAQVALEIAQVRCLFRGICFRFSIPRLRCLLTSRFPPYRSRQAASRELLNDLHNVTISLGFWETKLHDSPRSLWWFLLLQTGPRHFLGDLFHGLRVVVSACSSTISARSSKKLYQELTSMSRSPHLHVDEKVRALSAMQFSLASAVGEVHRHAGIVAMAWGNANLDSEHLRSLLHEELHGLMGTLQEVSTSKSTKNTSGQITSPKMAQSPLSKAVNTEFTPRPSPLGAEKAHNGLPHVKANAHSRSSSNGESVSEEIEDIWKLVHALEVEGSRASAKAKAVILANEKPLKWQRRWVVYSALSSAIGSLSFYAIRHSRLCGSSDLDNLMQSIWSALLRFWNTHAATPWKYVQNNSN
jgi:nuclear-control-of-ATPase protein 2